MPPKSVIEESKKLLGKVPQKPTLTLREQELLQTLGIDVLSNAKGFLSAKSHEICPTCLQSIPESHRTTSLQQIEHILNREVEEYRDGLKGLILTEVQTDTYQSYSVLDSDLLGKVMIQMSSVNKLIANHNEAVRAKIADPLSSIQYNSPEDLIEANILSSIVLRCSKMEIAAVKTAAISHLTTEIPQTDFCLTTWRAPLSGVPALFCLQQHRI